jgi:hypothetical protein
LKDQILDELKGVGQWPPQFCSSVITIFSSTTIVIGCGVVRWDLLALDIGVGLKGGSCAAAKLENVKTSKVSTYSADRLLLKLKP